MRSRFEAMKAPSARIGFLDQPNFLGSSNVFKAFHTIMPLSPTNYSFITIILIPHHMNMLATRKAISKAHELCMCLGAAFRFVLDVVAALAVPVGGSPLKDEAEFAELPSALTTT